jgi:hypothetical protein
MTPPKHGYAEGWHTAPDWERSPAMVDGREADIKARRSFWSGVVVGILIALWLVAIKRALIWWLA